MPKPKVQNIIMAVCIVILALFSALGFAAEAEWLDLTPAVGDSHWQSLWRGFMSGAAASILTCVLFGFLLSLGFKLYYSKKF